MKHCLFLLFLLLPLLSCGGPEYKTTITLELTVIARHRDTVEKEKLGIGALDYSRLPGILVELIPEHDLPTQEASLHHINFSSSENVPAFVAIRPGDQLIFVNDSYRPMILDSYDLMGHGFPIEVFADSKRKITSIEIKKECLNAVIFDRSNHYKITVTCNTNHKTYMRSRESFLFGNNPANPLNQGHYTLRISHPRLPPYEEPIYLSEESHQKKQINYTLGPLPKAGKEGKLPYVK
jgi:hypothetical protein